jgi:hypothetical protein
MHPVKVLLLATYPIVEPRHGGQLRTRYIYEEYKKAGIEVDYSGIFPEGAYPNHAPLDIQLPGGLANASLESYEHPVYDHLWGSHIATTELARSKLLLLLQAKQYDFVQVDHLFVWPLVRQCLADLDADAHRPKIVYSSQNIENEMKKQVLLQIGAPESAIRRFEREIIELERDVSVRADLVFAVSAADQACLNKLGSRQDCVLAKNGTSLSTVSELAIDDWKPILPREPFAAFISSAHLPNAVGFFSTFGQSMAFLPPDRKLVIAGGVTGLIEVSSDYRRWSAINNSRTIRLGIVDDIGVAALRRFAHVFVLPITAGGGSNIKTAEALLTGAHVLGTSTAFRGFEDYLGEPGVYVADSPCQFRKKLVDLLDQKRPVMTEATLEFRRHLLWDATLAVMPTHLLAHI